MVAPGQYRFSQAYLFQPIAVREEPARLAGGETFFRDFVGPKRTEIGGGWFWDNPGGDWIDANGVRMGTLAWATVDTAGVASGQGANYSNVNVTTLVQRCQTDARWLAIRLESGGATRYIAGLLWPNASERPSIQVTYTDGTQATLVCRIVAFCGPGTDVAATLFTESQTPVFMEFDRPAKAVSVATLSFRITQHFSGGGTAVRIWLLDPPLNVDPVQQGLAASAALDAGLVGHPRVIHLHRYVDGSTRGEFFYEGGQVFNFNAEAAYDPAVFGTGPQDLSKLPHVGQGKFIGAPPETAVPAPHEGSTWRIVPSTYKGEGFEPLAPGMGAIRMFMPKGLDVALLTPIQDGSYDQAAGHLGSDAKLFLPAAEFGKLREAYTRGYIRLATMDGGPYVEPASGRYNVYSDAAKTVPRWSSLGGKWGLMPAHDTYFGGVSGSSGGQGGWQARLAWNSFDSALGGPVEGGWMVAWHNFDFLNNNPVGNFEQPNYNFGTDPVVASTASRGGLGGGIYAHRWYCVETCLTLNTVSPEYPGFLPDGRLRLWIDGRLAKDTQGLVFRQAPTYNGYMSATWSSGRYAADQFSQAAISGMSAGKGYAGVCVRHNGGVEGPGDQYFYNALVSRRDATTAVVGLRAMWNSRWIHLALTDPIPWIDGDVLRLEARGINPTVLTVSRNGVALTLKWFINGSAVSGTSFTHADDQNYRSGGRVGIAGEVNLAASGLFVDNWSGGQIGGATATDGFTYSDGSLATVSAAAWTNHSPVGVARVASGRAHAVENGVIDPRTKLRPAGDVGIRDFWWNWFHGGITQNNRDRVIFWTGTVTSREYVGPMRLS